MCPTGPRHTEKQHRAHSRTLLDHLGCREQKARGAGPRLVAVVLQLVEGADARTALVHDASLLRGSLQGQGLQATCARTPTQLHLPHCPKGKWDQQSTAHSGPLSPSPAQPWGGRDHRATAPASCRCPPRQRHCGNLNKCPRLALHPSQPTPAPRTGPCPAALRCRTATALMSPQDRQRPGPDPLHEMCPEAAIVRRGRAGGVVYWSRRRWGEKGGLGRGVIRAELPRPTLTREMVTSGM